MGRILYADPAPLALFRKDTKHNDALLGTALLTLVPYLRGTRSTQGALACCLLCSGTTVAQRSDAWIPSFLAPYFA